MPAISFKKDILAENVNSINMDNHAFFIILDTPFEPYDTDFQELLLKSTKIWTSKLIGFCTL